MKIEQIYTGCLAQGAYYIESNGEVAIIDPLRDIQPYLDRAHKNGAKIKYILETHFHADFVSGHVDLAKATGAKIVFGPNAHPSFDSYTAKDGECIKLGDIVFQVIHTPGHTMESTCYLFSDEDGKQKALFTGDTLFIGDVGRPDLAQKSDLTIDDLAGHLYDSLHNKIMPLSDDLVIYPAHGAGSACGKNMSKETTDTLGHQKKMNYALQPMTRQQFVQAVTDGLMPPPAYFPLNVKMNKEGAASIHQILDRGKVELSPEAFEAAANETGALLLDTRHQSVFAKGFIPNSINISLDGSFAPWVGTLIKDIKQPILIIAEPGREEEVITRLARVGYDHSIGYLKGGFASWVDAGKEIDSVDSISPEDLKKAMELREGLVLDVRKRNEYNSEHIQGAENMPLDYINDTLEQIHPTSKYFIHCESGYRSMTFISILKARGFENLVDVQGGFKNLKSSGLFKLTDYVEPVSLL